MQAEHMISSSSVVGRLVEVLGRVLEVFASLVEPVQLVGIVTALNSELILMFA
jgi:hypothetical protein